MGVDAGIVVSSAGGFCGTGSASSVHDVDVSGESK